MAMTKTDKPERTDAPMKRRVVRRRKKVCVFCADKTNAGIDYWKVRLSGKIHTHYFQLLHIIHHEAGT